MACGDWLELVKTDQWLMKSTSIDTGAIVCLGTINAVRPVQVTASALIGKGVSHRCFSHQIPNCQQTQNAKAELISKVAEVEGGQGFTLISLIDSVSVET